MVRGFIRKKQNTIDNKHNELIKRLDDHIEWMKEIQKKSKEKKLVEWVSVEKEKKGVRTGNLISNSDIKNCYFTTVE